MTRHASIVLFLLAAVVLVGCNPPPKPRYYLRTDQLPEGTVTSVLDTKFNTQLLYIAELNSEPPSINVLPVSRLDVKFVSVDSMGEEDVLITYDEKGDRNVHSVHIDESPLPRSWTHVNMDTNKDGQTDLHILRFHTDSGFMEYFDLNADGTLDAQVKLVLNGSAQQECHILIEQSWVLVEGDKSIFLVSPHIATTRNAPAIPYEFQEGTWRKSEIPVTSQ